MRREPGSTSLVSIVYLQPAALQALLSFSSLQPLFGLALGASPLCLGCHQTGKEGEQNGKHIRLERKRSNDRLNIRVGTKWQGIRERQKKIQEPGRRESLTQHYSKHVESNAAKLLLLKSFDEER